MRSNVYLMLAFFAGIAVVGIAVFMLMIAAAHTVRPTFRYTLTATISTAPRI